MIEKLQKAVRTSLVLTLVAAVAGPAGAVCNRPECPPGAGFVMSRSCLVQIQFYYGISCTYRVFELVDCATSEIIEETWIQEYCSVY